MKMYKFKLEIGDDSGDGHGKHDDYIIECNYSVGDVEKAYKNSCKNTGLRFNENDDYTELNLNWEHPEYNDRRIAVEYESSTISKLAEEILLKHGINVRKDYEYYKEHPEEDIQIDGSGHFLEIFMNFIKISLPDLEYKLCEEDLPSFPISVGYGLFD